MILNVVCFELRNVVSTVKVNRAISNEAGETYKARSLCHGAFGYQSSLKLLLAGTSFSWKDFSFEAELSIILQSNWNCRPNKNALTLRKKFCQFLSFISFSVSIPVRVNIGCFSAICRLCFKVLLPIFSYSFWMYFYKLLACLSVDNIFGSVFLTALKRSL